MSSPERSSRSGWPIAGVAIVNLLALAVLGAFAYVWGTEGVPFGDFSDDARKVGIDKWYAGLLSDIGIGVWFLAVPAAIVAALAARKRPREAAFFVAMAIVSALLASDDLWLLHEEGIPDATGIPEQVTFAAYAVMVAAVVALSLPTIGRHFGWVFAVSLFALGLSLVIAKLSLGILSSNGAGSALKFLGIVNWTWFFVDAAVRNLRDPSLTVRMRSA